MRLLEPIFPTNISVNTAAKKCASTLTGILVVTNQLISATVKVEEQRNLVLFQLLSKLEVEKRLSPAWTALPRPAFV